MIYHDYYDVIHRDYNYDFDVAIVRDYLKTNSLTHNYLLEVGSGTGRHTALLSKHAQRIFALDKDMQMIPRAKKYIADLGIKNVHFFHGSTLDLQGFKIPPCNIGCAFFNVINYLLDSGSLESFFSSVAHTLTSRGLWIFDCLDPQKKYEPKAEFDFTYVINDQEYNRSVRSFYCSNNQTLQTHETFRGLLDRSVSTYEQTYKLWDLEEVKSAATTAGFKIVLCSKKSDMNLGPCKKNQIVFVMQKD